MSSCALATEYLPGSLRAASTNSRDVRNAASGLVDWRVAAEFLAGGLIGGLIGLNLASRLSVNKDALNRIFAAVVFCVAAYVLYRAGSALLAR